MIKIKYSQKNIKIPPRSPTPPKLKTILTPKKVRQKKLKMIHVLYGEKKINGSKLGKEIKQTLANKDLSENTHFVLGQQNKDFLLQEGVTENNIILIDEPVGPDFPSQNTFFYKIFLLNQAAKRFANDDILLLDYDCWAVRPLNKKDMHERLKKSTSPIQFPTYLRKKRWGGHFKSIDGSEQLFGPNCCFVYCRDHDIIRQWYEEHLKSSSTLNDEIFLLLVLEKMFGKLSLDRLYDFDTNIINTNYRAKGTSCYNINNYKDIYFKHN